MASRMTAQLEGLNMKKSVMRNLPWCGILLSLLAAGAKGNEATKGAPAAIPWNQIGATAGADYKGDGLSVSPSGSGAALHCVFQRLDGEATPKGLWLTSTVTNGNRFRVAAMEMGRKPTSGIFDRDGLE